MDLKTHKPWTTHDEERLRQPIESGVSPAKIGKDLGRTESAIRARAHAMRLTLRTLGTRRKVTSMWA